MINQIQSLSSPLPPMNLFSPVSINPIYAIGVAILIFGLGFLAGKYFSKCPPHPSSTLNQNQVENGQKIANPATKPKYYLIKGSRWDRSFAKKFFAQLSEKTQIKFEQIDPKNGISDPGIDNYLIYCDFWGRPGGDENEYNPIEDNPIKAKVICLIVSPKILEESPKASWANKTSNIEWHPNNQRLSSKEALLEALSV